MAFFTKSTFNVSSCVAEVSSKLTAIVRVRGSRRPSGRMPDKSTEMVRFTRTGGVF